MREGKNLLVAHMPYKVHVHRIWTDLAQPWVVGYHRNVFMRDFGFGGVEFGGGRSAGSVRRSLSSWRRKFSSYRPRSTSW